METKIIEVRDRLTYIPMLCVNMNPESVGSISWEYLREQGFPCNGEPNILMTHLRADGYATNDPYGWKAESPRTYGRAHIYIIKHWSELKTGSVVDVEFILGETTKPKIRQHLERLSL